MCSSDLKTGVAGSVTDLFALPQLNHHTHVLGGVLSEPASQLLKSFFAERRAQIKAQRDARQAMAANQALHQGLDILEEPATLPVPETTEVDADNTPLNPQG